MIDRGAKVQQRVRRSWMNDRGSAFGPLTYAKNVDINVLAITGCSGAT